MNFDFLIKEKFDQRIADIMIEANPKVPIYNIQFLVVIARLQTTSLAIFNRINGNITIMLHDDIDLMIRAINHESIHYILHNGVDKLANECFDKISKKIGL